MLVREQMGGHDEYAKFRGVMEALEIARDWQAAFPAGPPGPKKARSERNLNSNLT